MQTHSSFYPPSVILCIWRLLIIPQCEAPRNWPIFKQNCPILSSLLLTQHKIFQNPSEKIPNISNHHFFLPHLEAFDFPVIRSSAPRGLGISERPVSASSLIDYLRTRGRGGGWLGYPEPINYTSIRRRSATDLALQVGNGHARITMNHDADSRILENYYLNLAGFTDITSLGLGQHGIENDRSSVMAHENRPLALGALAHDPPALAKAHGPAPNTMMAKMLAMSEPEERTEHEERLFRRRVRWAAKKAVLSEESQQMRQTLLGVGYRERVSKLDVYGSLLNETLLEHRDLKNNPV